MKSFLISQCLLIDRVHVSILTQEFLPWSECSCRGIPNLEKKPLYIADVQVLASASGKA